MSMKGSGEEKLNEKALRVTSMKELTSKQNERLVSVESTLQKTSLSLHARIREASKHKGSKVPTDTLDKANAVAAKVLELITMASDLQTAGKAAHGVVPVFFKDAKHAVFEANWVSAKMKSLIVD